MSRAGDAGGRRTVKGGLKRVTGRPTAKRKPGGRLASRAWLGLELMAFRGPICGARHLLRHHSGAGRREPGGKVTGSLERDWLKGRGERRRGLAGEGRGRRAMEQGG